jgi:RimJ/RimL family protein N-acetyltransferase
MSIKPNTSENTFMERRERNLSRRVGDSLTVRSDPGLNTMFKHYPTTLIDIWRLRDGTRVMLRPILPQDSCLLGEFVTRLSSNTKRNRFHGAVNSLSELLLLKMSSVDYKNHLAFIVTREHEGHEQIIAEARYVMNAQSIDDNAEFAIVVDDQWLCQGLGERVMRAVISAASNAGLRWVHGHVLANNLPMLGLMRKCGFLCTPDRNDENKVHAELLLEGLGASLIARPASDSDTVIFEKVLRLWRSLRRHKAVNSTANHEKENQYSE